MRQYESKQVATVRVMYQDGEHKLRVGVAVTDGGFRSTTIERIGEQYYCMDPGAGVAHLTRRAAVAAYLVSLGMLAYRLGNYERCLTTGEYSWLVDLPGLAHLRVPDNYPHNEGVDRGDPRTWTHEGHWHAFCAVHEYWDVTYARCRTCAEGASVLEHRKTSGSVLRRYYLADEHDEMPAGRRVLDRCPRCGETLERGGAA